MSFELSSCEYKEMRDLIKKLNTQIAKSEEVGDSLHKQLTASNEDILLHSILRNDLSVELGIPLPARDREGTGQYIEKIHALQERVRELSNVMKIISEGEWSACDGAKLK